MDVPIDPLAEWEVSHIIPCLSQTSKNGTRFIVRVHSPPFPTREAHESAGSPEPRLIVAGDFKNMDYSFIEADGRDSRRIARVDRSFGEGLSVGPDNFSVQVASAVDVALVVLCSIVIDASINDGADQENGMVSLLLCRAVDPGRDGCK